MNKAKLIKKVLHNMKSDIYDYEESIFELAEIGLKSWSILRLKQFLGIEEEN